MHVVHSPQPKLPALGIALWITPPFVFACLSTWRPGRDVPIRQSCTIHVDPMDTKLDAYAFFHSAAWKELGGGFRTLPVGFPLPTIFWRPLFMLFCPLILDHGVCLIISISGLKILHSQILLDTSFYHCLQSVIIRSSLLLMNLHIVQFQYGLEFLRLSYSEFVQSFQDVIRWDLRHWQKNSVTFRIEFLNIIISNNNCK